ncbi:unnamed protein product [Penicillium palitans]
MPSVCCGSSQSSFWGLLAEFRISSKSLGPPVSFYSVDYLVQITEKRPSEAAVLPESARSSDHPKNPIAGVIRFRATDEQPSIQLGLEEGAMLAAISNESGAHSASAASGIWKWIPIRTRYCGGVPVGEGALVLVVREVVYFIGELFGIPGQ